MHPKYWWGIRHVRLQIHHDIFWKKWGHYNTYLLSRSLAAAKPTGKILVPEEFVADLNKMDRLRQIAKFGANIERVDRLKQMARLGKESDES